MEINYIEDTWEAVDVADGRFAAWLASLCGSSLDGGRPYRPYPGCCIVRHATAYMREGDTIFVQHRGGTGVTLRMSDTVLLPAKRIREPRR